MERRHLLQHGGLAGILAASSAPAFAQTLPEIRWRLTSSYPKSLDTLIGSAEHFSKRISDMTGGKFQIRVHAAGEIVPGLQVLDAVDAATVEVGQTIMYYYTGKNPALGLGAIVPFGMNARQHNAWWYHGGGSELYNDFLRAKYNCIAFVGLNTGTQMGGWYRKEIKSVADLKGLKFRVGSLAGQVLSRLGVVPQQIAGGEIYQALEKGIIDAAEWVGPYDDEKLGFSKVAKYYYTPGWWEGNAPTLYLVNAKAWDSLPKEYQNAFTAAAAESNVLAMAKYDQLNPPAMRRLLASGVQLRTFSRELLDACYKASMDQFAEWSDQNADFKKLYDSYSKFLDEQISWFRVAESTYDNYMSYVKSKRK
jgi:TRAP-type mannitol/chloroaromatic compound transport system substrate-binding protein